MHSSSRALPRRPPSPNAGLHGDRLSLFAPGRLVRRMLDDWFEKVHALAPVLHRRRFMHRLGTGEANTDRTFCALVVTVCAATAATLRRADYGPVTVEWCLDFIEEQNLLDHGLRRPAYSLDWCIAMYNIGTSASSLNEDGLGDMGSFHGMSEAAAGVRFLVYYRMADLDMSEQQLLKRLFWLLFAAYCSADIFGKLSMSLVSHQENRGHLRPVPLTDSQLDKGPQLSAAELPPWHGDTTSYVPGLNHLSDLFMTWHEAQTAPVSLYGGQEGALKHFLSRIQAVVDSFPPELRWRGGLSRPPHVTEGHDTQVANLLITSLNIRSNLLQKFGASAAETTRAAEHQRIVDDLLEILYRVPQHVLEQNGNSLIPKLRDCGAAYMEQMNIGGGGGDPRWLVSESARNKLEKLLRKLDDIDCWPGPSVVEASQSDWHAYPRSLPESHNNGNTQLIVKGKPFLMLSAELHNSSMSSARFMSEVWPAIKANHINTLLGAVAWEDVEPVEGQFDFSELDAVLAGARQHDMHLVLLWFGTYKNGISTYAPAWVKRDPKRFPRVQCLEAGGVKRTVEMVTPLSDEGCMADSRAFAELCRHLARVDAGHSTVLMIQVENETGLLGDSRDRSRRADEAFAQPVPEALLDHLSRRRAELHPKFRARLPLLLAEPPASSGGGPRSWTDVFGGGPAADEAFMAYHISSYVGRVAAAGRREYDIPMYTNTWLNFDDPSGLDLGGVPDAAAAAADRPGVYPSGGPCPHVLDIWRHNTILAADRALDFLAPDLYFHDYEAVCRDYTAQGNPLFIPEQRRDAKGARRVWLSYGTYGALGASPFGIDTGPEAVGREFGLLAQVAPHLLAARPEDRMGFFFDEEVDAAGRGERWTRVFGGEFEVTVERAFVFGKPGPGGGLVIHLGGARFLAVGRGFNVRFRSVRPEATFTGILSAVEKEATTAGAGAGADGTLRTLRVLNGDETRSGGFLIMPNDEPDYGGFPIAVTVPARTCIAEVEAYWIAEDEEDR
ncbi:glycoside hydrolase [Colletotrichum falcatum]|nr:glycoside hydrolase [Colletotrichum falcatum]